MNKTEERYLERAIELSRQGMHTQQGGPFGCIIVMENKIVGEGCNQVLKTNDPTAHAEIVAIRNACMLLKNYQLSDCVIYASCEPCPMCLGAIYWARARKVIYANTKEDAAAINFDDQFIYDEIEKENIERHIEFIHRPHQQAINVFNEWKTFVGKKAY
jgi:tRNA(Arg) A34 adenosine deaminase TadA